MAKRRRLANRCLRLLVFLLCCLAADFHHLHLPLTKQHTAHKFNDYLYSAQQAGNIAQQRIKCVRISAQHGCYRVAERIEYFYADITGDTPNQNRKAATAHRHQLILRCISSCENSIRTIAATNKEKPSQSPTFR